MLNYWNLKFQVCLFQLATDHLYNIPICACVLPRLKLVVATRETPWTLKKRFCGHIKNFKFTRGFI